MRRIAQFSADVSVASWHSGFCDAAAAMGYKIPLAIAFETASHGMFRK
ncbi:hypothetical protein [Planktotalea arctica]